MDFHRTIRRLGQGTVCYTYSLLGVQQAAVVVVAVAETQHEDPQIVLVLFHGSRSVVRPLAWILISYMDLDWDFSRVGLAEREDVVARECYWVLRNSADQASVGKVESYQWDMETGELTSSLVSRGCVDKATCRIRQMKHLLLDSDIYEKAGQGCDLARCFALAKNWAHTDSSHWAEWSRTSQPRVRKCGHEQTHTEAQRASYCCGLEAAEDHPTRPQHRPDVLGNPAPSPAARRSSAVDGVDADSWPPVAPQDSRSHMSSHPREMWAQLAQSASVALQCGCAA